MKRNGIIFAGLAMLCLIAYSNSFQAPFHFDDLRLIRFNFSLRNLTDWGQIALTERFRPLLISTFALNFQIGKHDPFSYHVVNLLLHFAAVSLFYILAKRQSFTIFVPVLAAALMAAHPVNTESVTYISSRSIVLCSVFYLSALICFDSFVRRSQRRSIFLFFVCFICGILVKEEAFLIAPATLLYDLIFFGWSSVKKHRGFHIATHFFFLIAASIRMFLNFKYQIAFPHPPGIWFPTEITVWLRYLWLAIYPVNLNVDPDVRPIDLAHFAFWLSLLFLACLMALLWKIRKKHPFLSFWALWFFLNLIAASAVPLNDFMAEHRMYISLFGFCAVISHLILIPLGAKKRSAAFAGAFVAVLISFYMISTYQRNRVWASELTLWYDSAQKSPEKPRPHINLGGAYSKRKAYDLAIQEYLYALSLDPRSPQAYSGLGICYLQKRNLEKAEESFSKALLLQPGLPDATAGLGMVLFHKHEYDDALAQFESVYGRRKESIPLVDLMSEAYFRTRRYDRASEMILSGIRLNPAIKKWYPRLMESYFRAGKKKEAAAVYDSYHHQFPTDERTLARTAFILKALGRQQEAQKLLDKHQAR